MRPYLGILRDSFREAVASRVLWILFVVATLFLAAIAPFGIRDVRPTRLTRNALANWNSLATKLADQAAATPAPPANAAPDGKAPDGNTPAGNASAGKDASSAGEAGQVRLAPRPVRTPRPRRHPRFPPRRTQPGPRRRSDGSGGS